MPLFPFFQSVKKSIVLILEQDLELLQFILALHLHLHHHIHTLLLGDEELRHKPKVVAVFVEAHGRPFVAGDCISERQPMIAPSRQRCSDTG